MKIAAATQVDQLADMLADLSVRLAAIEKVGHVHDVGVIEMYAHGTIPATHLECVGGTVLIADYPVYAQRVGTTFGGNGTTTVGLPDFRGRAPQGRGTGDASGATNQVLGTKYGEQTHTLSSGESGMPGHSVNAETTDHSHGVGAGVAAGYTGYISHDHTHTVQTYGQSVGHRHGTSAGTYYVYAHPVPYTTIATDTGNVTLYLTYAADTGYNIEDHSHTGYTSGVSSNHYHLIGGRDATHTHTVTAVAASGAHENRGPRTTVVLAIRVKL